MSQILSIFEFRTSDVKILNSIWRLAMSKNQNTLISGHRKSKNEQLTIPYSTTKIKLTKGGQTVKMRRKYAGVAEPRTRAKHGARQVGRRVALTLNQSEARFMAPRTVPPKAGLVLGQNRMGNQKRYVLHLCFKKLKR